jgi:hypothetical protein
MSNFSAGIMLKAEHEAVALEYMEDNVFLIRLNSNWLCRLSANDESSMMNIAKYSKAVLDLSERIPLMHVVHPEDHCFGLCILHESELVCRFGVSYEFDEFDMGECPEMANPMGFGRFIEDEFKQFKLFGFSDNDCARMFASFTEADMSDYENKTESVRQLFSILGIEEFEFVSHHYASSDKKRGETHFDVIKW